MVKFQYKSKTKKGSASILFANFYEKTQNILRWLSVAMSPRQTRAQKRQNRLQQLAQRRQKQKQARKQKQKT